MKISRTIYDLIISLSLIEVSTSSDSSSLYSDAFDLDSNDYFTFSPHEEYQTSENRQEYKNKEYEDNQNYPKDQGNTKNEKKQAYEGKKNYKDGLTHTTGLYSRRFPNGRAEFHLSNLDNKEQFQKELYQQMQVVESPRQMQMYSQRPLMPIETPRQPKMISPQGTDPKKEDTFLEKKAIPVSNLQSKNINNNSPQSQPKFLLSRRIPTPNLRTPTSVYSTTASSAPILCPICKEAFALVLNLQEHLSVHL